MRLIFRLFLIFSPLLLASCARPLRGVSQTPVQPTPAAGVTARQVVIFIPQSDQTAGAWLQLMDRHPNFKMVLALSPRFQRFAKDADLRSRLLALQKSGRLDLALQVSNAPLLPLLINTDMARDSLPPHSLLPDPPFAYPDDAAQIIALSKADFTRVWTIAPKGIVLPYGAASPELLRLLTHVGMQWAVAALGAPSYDGIYQAGSLRVLDATPVSESAPFGVQVWDERRAGNTALSLKTLGLWVDNLEKQQVTSVLPADPDLPVKDLKEAGGWLGRTWTTTDWSLWIGTPAKNATWEWLRRTRQALEKYKDSGRASVQRLDAAFSEIYTAENANFFSSASEELGTTPAAVELEQEFKATLATVYRLIGQAPPDDLFSAQSPSRGSAIQSSSPTATWEMLPDGRGHLAITDPANDNHGDGRLTDPLGPKAIPGTYDLRRFDVWAASSSLDFVVTLGTVSGTSLGSRRAPGPLIDIYMDINRQPNIGTLALLPGRGVAAAPIDAWEYCLCLVGTKAQFYRTRGSDSYELVTTFPVAIGADGIRVTVPRDTLRGNPQRWGYQVLVLSYDPASPLTDPRPLIQPSSQGTSLLPIYDLLDPPDIPQAQLLSDVESGRRSDIPFIRLNTP